LAAVGAIATVALAIGMFIQWLLRRVRERQRVSDISANSIKSSAIVPSSARTPLLSKEILSRVAFGCVILCFIVIFVCAMEITRRHRAHVVAVNKGFIPLKPIERCPRPQARPRRWLGNAGRHGRRRRPGSRSDRNGRRSVRRHGRTDPRG
jgi:hypothetical protein